MGRMCEFTGKKTRSGQSRSHSMVATKRTFKPNIIKIKMDIGNGIKIPLKIAASEYKKFRGMI